MSRTKNQVVYKKWFGWNLDKVKEVVFIQCVNKCKHSIKCSNSVLCNVFLYKMLSHTGYFALISLMMFWNASEVVLP